MGAPDGSDWGKIHAKAWTDPAYRKLLETDPTAALKQYAAEHGKTFDTMMNVGDKPSDISDEHLRKVVSGDAAHTSGPPACC